MFKVILKRFPRRENSKTDSSECSGNVRTQILPGLALHLARGLGQLTGSCVSCCPRWVCECMWGTYELSHNDFQSRKGSYLSFQGNVTGVKTGSRQGGHFISITFDLQKSFFSTNKAAQLEITASKSHPFFLQVTHSVGSCVTAAWSL